MPRPEQRTAPHALARRDFLATAAGRLVAGLGVLGELATAPAARAATASGYASGGGYVTVSTGAGLTFSINQSNGDMTSLNYNGVELQDQSSFSQVESGLGSGTLYHYLAVVNGQNNIYLATYVNSAGAGELRWISRLNPAVISTVLTPAEVNGGTAIESTDIYLLDGQTRSKCYSNRRAMDLTVRGVTGSGIGVYMAYAGRESSAGGPFFRDIEQQGATDHQLYNYRWSAHNQTGPQRLDVRYGPYALMLSGITPPAAPDMSFMDTLGLMGNVPASGRGYAAGATSGVTSGATVGFANATAQYWAVTQSNGDHDSPAMKPGTYTMTLYQDELAVAAKTVTVTAGTTNFGQNIDSAWFTPASPVFRIGAWTGTPAGFLNSGKLTTMHPSDTRMASCGSSSDNPFPACQFKNVNNPTTIRFTLTSSQLAARTVRIDITAAYAGGRAQITVNNWTPPAPAPSAQPNSRSLTIAFVAGTNTMTISVISGSGALSSYLSPSFSYDRVEMY